MQKLQNNLKIGISALGLIGGSIYKSLKKQGFVKLFAHTNNQKTVEIIKSEGFFADNEISILKNCDLIFVCSPISETIRMIKEINKINPSAIIADVASLKANILQEIETTTSCKFIGTHPMAGTENSGFGAAFADLFEGAKWVITPSKNVAEEDVSLLMQIIKCMGADIISMDANKHDEAVAFISHAPMLIAQALMSSVVDNKEALALAASGFRDMTRLSMSNKLMAKDMLLLNKNNIELTLKKIIANAQNLLEQDFFDENIDKIIDLRKSLYNNEGKNIY